MKLKVLKPYLMKNFDSLLAVVSWEERFLSGMILNFENNFFKKVVLFEFEGYEDRNKGNLDIILDLCKINNVEVSIYSLNFATPKENWFLLKKTIIVENVGVDVLLDFTTMPRETIWSILFFLEQVASLIDYVYYRPSSYNDVWLSRDPSSPRLLYKMSGISELGRPTLLVVFAGHDYQRLSYLINRVEPFKVILASQGDEKNEEVVTKCITDFDGNLDINRISFDNLSEAKFYSQIAEIIEENLAEFNIVIASLGPKFSAIPIYQINRAYPETALCYVPCKEFNELYSVGIDKNNISYGTLTIPKRKYQLAKDY